jgi:ligand-binding sensor domain-containing protein
MAVAGEGTRLIATKQGVFMQAAHGWTLSLQVPAKRLYAHRGAIYACAKDGLYESEDGGRSWRNLLPGQEARAVHFSRGEIVAAAAKGIYRRRDKGEGTWEMLVPFGKEPLDVREMAFTQDGLLIAAKEGIFTTGADGGLRREDLPVSREMAEKVELKKVITDLHTGEFFGKLFYLVADATALGLVLLSATGVYLWYRPRKATRTRPG